MPGTVQLPVEEYRFLFALRYLNACEAILNGMKHLRGPNDFPLLVTMRSFIEYTRRGIWFLAWASEDQLRDAGKLTFNRAGSPNLTRMDEMINEALGLGKVSHLRDTVRGMDEPFIDCLHALTHGNPFSVRVLGIGIDKVFQTDALMKRAEMEKDMFATLVYRRALGEDLETAWRDLAAAVDDPAKMRKIAQDAASKLKERGPDQAFTGPAAAIARDALAEPTGG